MLLHRGDKLLFIGDSITDSDRRKPEGEGLFYGSGKGYVSLVDGLLQTIYPDYGIRVVNKGNSGDTVRNLAERWQEDVLEQKPQWLVIMIGINDVWRQYDLPFMPETHVYKEEYEATLRQLVSETKPKVEGLVLMTPFFIESNRQDKMRATMDEYGAIVRKLADEYGTLFVDTQAAFNKVLEELHSSALAWDRVHPTTPGHMVLARAFLNTIGFQWNR